MLSLDLSGRTALVTGSTQGIGLAIAIDLAGAGARVAVNGRSSERVDAAVARVREGGPRAGTSSARSADVTTSDGASRRSSRTCPTSTSWSTTSGSSARRRPGDRRRRVAALLRDQRPDRCRLIRPYLPGMTGTGWGGVLDVASDSAVAVPAEMIHYGMSKTALLALAGFAKEAAGSGVTVNSVLAGPTHTGGMEDFVWPAGRPGTCPGRRRNGGS